MVQSIVLKGHSLDVLSVAFSPDGQLLASSSWDKTVVLWNTKSGEQVATLQGHKDKVWSVVFSPDGTTIATGSGDKTIKLWNAASKTEITTLLEDGAISSIAFSPDGALLVSATTKSTARVWDVRSRTLIRTMEDSSPQVRHVTFSPDGQTIASAGGKNVWLWDVGSGSCLATLTGHTLNVYSVAFSPAGDYLATGSHDHTIILWDVARRTPITTFQGHSSWVRLVAFSPNGKYLASGSQDKTIRLWDIASRSHHSTLTGHSDQVFYVAFSPDGSQLASAGGMDNTARLWSLPSQFVGRSERTVLPSVKSPLSPSSHDLRNDITHLISLAGSVYIGAGGFGEVCTGTHKDRGKVALKRTQKSLDDASARRFLREVDLWCSVSHRYILPCLGMCKFDPYIYVVSPFIENGDLHSCISKGISFNRSKILYEVAEALAHLHHLEIVHGDVKALNVLLSNDRRALLCDFGLAKILDSTATSTEVKGTGSARWMAPEMFRNASRSMATDVYSFGMTISEILSGQAPYPEITDNIAVVVHVLFDGGRPPKSPMKSPEGKSYSILWEAAEKCWAKEAENRPHMAQVLGMLFPLAREKN